MGAIAISQCPSSVVYHALCVVRRQQFALNDIFSETTMPRTLIFGMKQCLASLFNSVPRVQNGLAAGS